MIEASVQGLYRRLACSFVRFTFRQPGQHRHSRKPPVLPKAPAWQLSLLCVRSNRVRRRFEKRGDLFECEDLLGWYTGTAGDLHSPNGKLTAAGRQSISKQFADKVLLRTTGRLRQTVERSRLTAGEANIQRGAFGSHTPMISNDIIK